MTDNEQRGSQEPPAFLKNWAELKTKLDTLEEGESLSTVVNADDFCTEIRHQLRRFHTGRDVDEMLADCWES